MKKIHELSYDQVLTILKNNSRVHDDCLDKCLGMQYDYLEEVLDNLLDHGMQLVEDSNGVVVGCKGIDYYNVEYIVEAQNDYGFFNSETMQLVNMYMDKVKQDQDVYERSNEELIDDIERLIAQQVYRYMQFQIDFYSDVSHLAEEVSESFFTYDGDYEVDDNLNVYEQVN